MKRILPLCLLTLSLVWTLCPAALAIEPMGASVTAQVCYPTSISRSEDGAQLKKIYDLGPEEDPAGIPRSDFEQDGFHYTLTDLLRQELPENETRQHTETVSIPSKNKDMESVLALLPAEKEFITDDGLTGVLSLDLSTVRVEAAGYGSFTAVATYTGTATSSYVKGYTVTADYTGTVSRIALNKVRYVAIFEGTPLIPILPDEPEDTAPVQFNWLAIAIPFGLVALVGAGTGAALLIKRRHEAAEEDAE